jgi:inhibitor of KinA sporulation pathway (predicted exonuclease)
VLSKLNKIIVVDIEATCWQKNPPPGESNEIIEIGICVLNMDLNQPPVRSDRRSILVQPDYSRVSKFCTELTTLTQSLLDKEGIVFAEACEILKIDFDSKACTWASYGDYDRRQFETDCRKKNVQYPFGLRHINVKNLFAHMWRLPKEVGMPAALEILGHKLDGTHHRGHDDAWNIAGILSEILNLRKVIK